MDSLLVIRVSIKVVSEGVYKTALTVGAAASCYWIIAVGEQAVHSCCLASYASLAGRLQHGTFIKGRRPVFHHRCLGDGKGTCMSSLASCTTPTSCKLAWGAGNACVSVDPACKLQSLAPGRNCSCTDCSRSQLGRMAHARTNERTATTARLCVRPSL